MNNQMITSFSRELATHQKSFQSVLPAHVSPQKFMRTVVGAVQNNPDILQCDRNTIFSSCQKAAQDGLLLDGREAALVKFKTKINGQYVNAAQYMPMVNGILKKIRNSGMVSTITAQTVHQNDSFKYNPAMDDVPNHNPDWFGDRGDMVGVYSVARMKDGGTVVEIMNLKQIEKVRNVSRSKDRGPWSDWYEEMAIKTVLRRISKFLPSSADVDQMFDNDNDNYDLKNNAEDAEVVDVNNHEEPHKPEGKKQTRASAIVTESAVDFDAETGEVIEAESVENKQPENSDSDEMDSDPI